MQRINHTKFFEEYKKEFGPLSQNKVDGLSFLLTALEADTFVVDITWAAYMLATVKHETADTYQPIEEYGKGKGRKYGFPNSKGKLYYGRGYVQLTWEANYKMMTKYVGADLVNHPELALTPTVAYCIMSMGMRHGYFTSKKLCHYLNGSTRDYQNARRIINGVDCAEKIARYAIQFESVLEKS